MRFEFASKDCTRGEIESMMSHGRKICDVDEDRERKDQVYIEISVMRMKADRKDKLGLLRYLWK